MKRYAQIDSNGLCVTVSDFQSEADAPNLIRIGPEEDPIGHTWVDGQWVAPPEPVPVPDPVRIDTPLFLLRFTPYERIALRERAEETDMIGKLLADWLSILGDPRLAYVEIGDSNLTAAMAMLVEIEMLTQERADEILSF